MTKRQYLLHHILHLAVELEECSDTKQRENLQTALQFYMRELHEHDKQTKPIEYRQ